MKFDKLLSLVDVLIRVLSENRFYIKPYLTGFKTVNIQVKVSLYILQVGDEEDF